MIRCTYNGFPVLRGFTGCALLFAILSSTSLPAQDASPEAPPAPVPQDELAPEAIPALPPPLFTVYGSSLSDNKIIKGTLVPVNDRSANYGIAVVPASGGGTITVPGAKDQVENLKEPLSLYFGLAPGRPSSRYNRSLREEIEFGPVGVWRRARYKVAGGLPELAPVDAASDTLSTVALEVITREPGEQPVQAFFTAVRKTKDAIDTAMTFDIPIEAKAQLQYYRDLLDSDLLAYVARLRANPVTRDSANEALDATRILEKDFYRTSDNYRPEVNKMAINSSESTVAIVSAVGRDVKVGTGFLVAPNTVLTCWHVVSAGRITTFENRSYNVRFFDDHRPRKWLDPKETVDVGCKVICRDPKLDYCILELAPDDRIDTVPCLPLSTLGTKYQTPVIIIGYPQGGNLTMHENSWVVFPYRLDQEDRARLEARLVRDSISTLSKLDDAAVSDRYQQAIVNVQKQLDAHYQKRVSDPHHLYTHFYDGEHYIGIESDTFRGNSGSPVITRERGQVVAMLRKGVEIGTHIASTGEAEFRRMVSSQLHERAIPIEEIIRDIETKMGKNWLKERGFKIYH